MPEPWDSLSPEAQAELQGYVSYAGDTASEFRQGALDHAAYAYADMGNAYQAFLTGRNMQPTPTPVTMETTTETSDPLVAPPSMQSALLSAGAAAGREQEEAHWRDYARDNPVESEANSWEDYSATFHGVGPASSPDTTAQTSHGPQQEADAHEPEI